MTGVFLADGLCLLNKVSLPFWLATVRAVLTTEHNLVRDATTGDWIGLDTVYSLLILLTHTYIKYMIYVTWGTKWIITNTLNWENRL